jgi:mannose-6-phosphate isomerase-like protein (cupin superfamily)
MKTDKPIALAPGEGKTMVVLGTSYTIKVAGETTGGAFCLVESVVPSQVGVPPHVHQREQETFYILEGTMEIQCAGRTIMATPGTTVTLPKNVPHAYRNPANVPMKCLVLIEPAGFEGFFEEVAKLPADQPPDLGKIAAIGQKYGLELLPPG